MGSHDLLCFSHLRWNFVFQRPNHLMTRCARSRRVFYVEEPTREPDGQGLELHDVESGIVRVVPRLRHGLEEPQGVEELARALEELCARELIRAPVHWFYSPMFLPATRFLPRSLTVYDCMDELTGFLNAPSELTARERSLMAQADVMFTGGHALYEAKRTKHPNVHPIPSSVDVPFFAQARELAEEPVDQQPIAGPRLGYYGVIDERIDLGLLTHLADARPDWHIIMVGPVVKIDPADLPRRANIHYLGQKSYAELPAYASGWDVALMPFALNDATRFISPTKTPEYLAAGLPVVSTAIRDVVEPYERMGLVHIARSPDEFVEQVGRTLAGDEVASPAERDAFLAQNSWETTWARMDALLERRAVVQASEAAAACAAE